MYPWHSRYSAEETARRGDEIYERHISSRVRPDDEGKFGVIDIETSAYEVDWDEVAASDRLLTRYPVTRRCGSGGSALAMLTASVHVAER